MSNAISTALEVLSTVSSLVPIPALSPLVQLALFVLEQRRPPDWETIKAQIGGLNAEATIVSLRQELNDLPHILFVGHIFGCSAGADHRTLLSE